MMGRTASSESLATGPRSDLDPAPDETGESEARTGRGSLCLHDVAKRWGEVSILEGLDLEVAPGTSAWVGGHNGAGKTTLLRIVAGLLQADSGTVTFDGLSPSADRRRYQSRIGFLSAGDRGIYARLSVRQNLDLWTRLSFVPRRECRSVVQRALQRFALEQLGDARADRLSLGQRQRLRLAGAFLHSPGLVLLDEPANSLDDEGLELLSAALADLNAGGGICIWCAPNRPSADEVTAGYQLVDRRLEGEPVRESFGAYAGAAAAVVKRDFLLMTSYRFRFVTQLLSAFFGLTLFYYISRLVHVGEGITPDDYYAFAVTGLMTLQVINSTLSTPSITLRQELVAGTFERFAISPFGAVGGIVSMMIFPLLYTLVIVFLMLVFAGLVFGLALQWATVPLSIPLGALAALSFAPIGVLIIAAVMLAKQASAGTNWVVAGVSLVGGLYFPVALLPSWIQWMSEVQPFTPAVDLMRYVLLGMDLSSSAWLDLTKLVLFVLVLLPISLLALARAVRISTRRGTIIEY